jgi:predicted Na+-dependent transporter
MTLTEFIQFIGAISGLLFVLSSMLAMGLSLTVPMIVKPLKNVSLVVRALLANFVLVPILAYLILLLIPLEGSLGIGLIVLACAAGAPFLPNWFRGRKVMSLSVSD